MKDNREGEGGTVTMVYIFVVSGSLWLGWGMVGLVVDKIS